MKLPNLFLCILVTLNLQVPISKAEAISTALGAGSMNVLSSTYKVQTIPFSSTSLKFRHNLSGRWSIVGEYFSTLSSVFSGYSGGLRYESAKTVEEHDNFDKKGKYELSITPQWQYQAWASFGKWRYLNAMRKAFPKAGEESFATVEAQLYGASGGIGINRFISKSFSLGAELTSMYSTGSNFSVNATQIGAVFSYEY